MQTLFETSDINKVDDDKLDLCRHTWCSMWGQNNSVSTFAELFKNYEFLWFEKKLALELNRRRLLSTYAIVYVRHRKYLLICQASFGESNLSLNTRLEGKRTEEF